MLSRLSVAVFEFAMLSMVFTAIAICFHGLRRHRPSEQVLRDWRINLAFLVTDVVIVAPLHKKV